MKTAITAAAILFAANLSAAEIYKELGYGNPDLSRANMTANEVVGTQPSVGDRVDRYQGFGAGNTDVVPQTTFSSADAAASSSARPEIYVGPGLKF